MPNKKNSIRMSMSAFYAKAILEGYINKKYWMDQYKEFVKGNRGPDMHDFTLVNLS
jgi:hypothetical protein